VVRTAWIQRTGAAAYVQRHLPTGGLEIHCPMGGRPQLIGPLTGPEIEVIPPCWPGRTGDEIEEVLEHLAAIWSCLDPAAGDPA
jgi:hypothetical protein